MAAISAFRSQFFCLKKTKKISAQVGLRFSHYIKVRRHFKICKCFKTCNELLTMKINCSVGVKSVEIYVNMKVRSVGTLSLLAVKLF